MTKIILKNLSDTERLANNLASLIDRKFLLTLNGDLAAGKTTFTKYFAKAIDIEATVTSPTFNILKEYEGDDYYLCHIDAYRLEDNDEELPFEDIFYEDKICFVEWAEYIDDFLPKERLTFSLQLEGDVRVVNISSIGDKYKKIESELEKLWLN
ncbi:MULTISPECIES: tRNA (adenosine(37)-N6)-threonylcarbamoyltransferase complex ATPase subunit type 1 TsaE [unclassified Gemella]|uniref:tRNA (adenosine(37)-N6)-threonylcarbamoyltransferase complex ATPase subunit type 1 TsaE n=1 Tax=unclassified Gemella TaxID=2624949 RepID=UPI0015D01FE9|nr:MULTISPECIES: tRNA (adenosine(37)-N6)-threonylcarbamoyltransferase complex ATPase subunit type 1 TsaE [unclassified Gemella]MBF0709667.1 tRNA (adenosine(37)-N6)-threonylcarbamoyltransferase complex ATPase subunit type 1 TsaE [Gemella sp. GL1.1]NYS27011.1 tRNA (adenosine(37)-N6)-threonylcarbamoyltransferase complex ATPase subunit type 1 TsaE [Gemella sp. GL1]